jgi:hypothetical protein
MPLLDQRPDRQTQQPGAEPDRQLVKADAYTERQGAERSTPRQREQAVLLVLLGGEHVDAESDDERSSDVVGRASDRVSERRAERNADERHRGLESGEQERDAEPVLPRQTREPESHRNTKRVEAHRDDQSDQLECLAGGHSRTRR